MKKSNWYENKISRILVDMHIPDWREDFLSEFSPEEYAQYMKQSGAKVIEISSRSCLGLCYWPTKIGTPHKNVGNNDFLGRALKACKDLDQDVIIYMNVWARCTYDEHPEWQVKVLHNSGSLDRMGICCPNTPYQEYFLSLLDEMNSQHECSGLWIDMIGWFRQVCYCDSCQARYQRESGYSGIPEIVDWNDPKWVAFQKLRISWMTEFATNIRKTIKARTPERSVAMQSGACRWAWRGGIEAEFFQQSDYLAGDLYINQYQQSFIRKMFNSFSRTRPVEFMITRCESLMAHTTNKSQSDLELRAYASVANQCAFTLIDAIDPSGSMKPNFYKKAAILNQKLNAFTDYISPNTKSMADVAVYYQPQFVVDACAPAKRMKDFLYEVDEIKRYYHLARILQEHHILFDIIGPLQLNDLKKYRLIILPECAFMSSKECEIFRQYVAEGGRIYASGATSLYNADSAQCKDFQLADVFGVHFDGGYTEPVNYLSPKADCNFDEEQEDIMLNFRQLHIKATPNTEVFCTRTLAISQPSENTFFGAALSCPPEKAGQEPGMVKNLYGKGVSIYCAGSLEYENYYSHRKILGNIFNYLLDSDKIVETNAYLGVEFTCYEDTANSRLLLSILNCVNDNPPILSDIQLKLKVEQTQKIKSIVSVPDGKSVDFYINEKNRIVINIDKLAQYIMLEIKF